MSAKRLFAFEASCRTFETLSRSGIGFKFCHSVTPQFENIILSDLCTIVILPTGGVKNVRNGHLLRINSLFVCVFALPMEKIPARAKVSLNMSDTDSVGQ